VVHDKYALERRLEYVRLMAVDPFGPDGQPKRPKFSFLPNASPDYYGNNRVIQTRKRQREEGPGGEDDIPPELMEPTVRVNLNIKAQTKEVNRDIEGRAVMPVQAKGATIYDLGRVVYDKPAYHSKAYIWPVGYKSMRKLPSIKNTKEYVFYTSEILDGGKAPIFQVSPQDNPNLKVTHSTSSGVWCEVLKMIKRKPNVSVSGPEMYGFSDPTIKMLIQELPNADKCESYEWKEFDAPGAYAYEDDSNISTLVATPSKAEKGESSTPVKVELPNPNSQGASPMQM